MIGLTVGFAESTMIIEGMIVGLIVTILVFEPDFDGNEGIVGEVDEALVGKGVEVEGGKEGILVGDAEGVLVMSVGVYVDGIAVFEVVGATEGWPVGRLDDPLVDSIDGEDVEIVVGALDETKLGD